MEFSFASTSGYVTWWGILKFMEMLDFIGDPAGGGIKHRWLFRSSLRDSGKEKLCTLDFSQ